MTTPVSAVTAACAGAAFVLAYVPAFIRTTLAFSSAKKPVAVSNMDPRQTVSLAVASGANSGLVSRANSAHYNQLEGLPWFYGSLVFATLCGVPRDSVDAVAALNVGARVVYIWLFLTGTAPWKATLRTIVWSTCSGSCAYLFVRAAMAAK
jgi:uncharacterized MAPEG superfamily protein